MKIETFKNETLIRIPSTINYKVVQSVIEYLRIVEILMKNKGSEKSASKLADDIDTKWWEINKTRFIK